MFDLRSVDIVESDEIPAFSLELASEKRTQLVERLAQIDVDLFQNDALPLAAVISGPCRFWRLMVPFGITIVVC